MEVQAEDLNPQPSDSGEPQENLELIMIANAKKIGLSLMELNEFTVSEFMKLVDIYIGDDKPQQKTRAATQADIDKLLG